MDKKQVNSQILNKLSQMPSCLLKTHIKAVLEAKELVEKRIKLSSIITPLQHRIGKICELIEKIIDQYMFLESMPQESAVRINSLSQAEEAACDAVRYLLKAGR